MPSLYWGRTALLCRVCTAWDQLLASQISFCEHLDPVLDGHGGDAEWVGLMNILDGCKERQRIKENYCHLLDDPNFDVIEDKDNINSISE